MSNDSSDACTVQTVELTVVDKLRMLLDITKKISRSLDLEEVLSLVMDTLGSLLPHDAAGIYVIERGAQDAAARGVNIFRAKAMRGYHTEDLRELQLKTGEGIIGYVAQTREPVISPDVRRDPRYVNARKETRSEMVAPIISNDEVIGVFDLECDAPNAYDGDDLQVLMLLASQVAIIIEKAMLHEQLLEKKRLETQLEVARQVQLSLLPPRDPQLAGYDISAYNFSTEEVSGDYYDFVKLYEDQLGLVIADVSGKGVPAALLMAFLRASLRAAIQAGYAPNVALSNINNLLWDSIEHNQFVTVFYGVLDATNHTLAYVNAGHNPPLLFDANEESAARFVEHGGLPLGMFEKARYYQYFLSLKPGQILVIYTDGVTEATDREGREYGRERLLQAVRAGKDLTARKMIQFIYEDVLAWTEGRGADDDVTLIVVKAL